MVNHPKKTKQDPTGFWSDQDLVFELKKDGSDLCKRAAASIKWLREEMIDPSEYMRVSNERGAALTEISRLQKEEA